MPNKYHDQFDKYITNVLSKPNLFTKTVENLNDLWRFINRAPWRVESIVNYVISRPTECMRLIPTLDDLTNFIITLSYPLLFKKNFIEDEETCNLRKSTVKLVVNNIINSPAEFTRLVETQDNLHDFIGTLNSPNQVIKRIKELSDQDERSRLKLSFDKKYYQRSYAEERAVYDLMAMHVKSIVNYVINSPTEYERLICNDNGLGKLIVVITSQHLRIEDRSAQSFMILMLKASENSIKLPEPHKIVGLFGEARKILQWEAGEQEPDLPLYSHARIKSTLENSAEYPQEVVEEVRNINTDNIEVREQKSCVASWATFFTRCASFNKYEYYAENESHNTIADDFAP